MQRDELVLVRQLLAGAREPALRLLAAGSRPRCRRCASSASCTRTTSSTVRAPPPKENKGAKILGGESEHYETPLPRASSDFLLRTLCRLANPPPIAWGRFEAPIGLPNHRQRMCDMKAHYECLWDHPTLTMTLGGMFACLSTCRLGRRAKHCPLARRRRARAQARRECSRVIIIERASQHNARTGGVCVCRRHEQIKETQVACERSKSALRGSTRSWTGCAAARARVGRVPRGRVRHGRGRVARAYRRYEDADLREVVLSLSSTPARAEDRGTETWAKFFRAAARARASASAYARAGSSPIGDRRPWGADGPARALGAIGHALRVRARTRRTATDGTGRRGGGGGGGGHVGSRCRATAIAHDAHAAAASIRSPSNCSRARLRGRLEAHARAAMDCLRLDRPFLPKDRNTCRNTASSHSGGTPLEHHAPRVVRRAAEGASPVARRPPRSVGRRPRLGRAAARARRRARGAAGTATSRGAGRAARRPACASGGGGGDRAAARAPAALRSSSLINRGPS